MNRLLLKLVIILNVIFFDFLGVNCLLFLSWDIGFVGGSVVWLISLLFVLNVVVMLCMLFWLRVGVLKFVENVLWKVMFLSVC